MDKQKRFNDNIPLAKYYIKNVGKKYLRYFEYDDLWQIVLIGLWKAAENFNGDEKAWSACAYSYMRNEISAEKWRMFEKNGSKIHNEAVSLDLTYDGESPVYNPSVEYDYTESIIQKDIKKEILKLSKKQRYCIQKRYFEGMKIVDIAKELNCSANNVKGLIDYGRNKIKHNLNKGA